MSTKERACGVCRKDKEHYIVKDDGLVCLPCKFALERAAAAAIIQAADALADAVEAAKSDGGGFKQEDRATVFYALSKYRIARKGEE